MSLVGLVVRINEKVLKQLPSGSTLAEGRIRQEGINYLATEVAGTYKKRLPRFSKTDASKQNEKPTLNKSLCYLQ